MKLESGLEFKDDIVGRGDVAKTGDVVRVHYTGWNIGMEADLFADWVVDTTKNELKFDSSVDRGTPFEFKLGAGMVIKGWDEGVQGMAIGGKRTLIIPSQLAYGEQGAGGVIQPNADLKFVVELLEIIEEPKPEIVEETEGNGEIPKVGENVKLHFRITQLEPQEVVAQDSYTSGQPMVIGYQTKQLPEFLETILEGMRVGSKRTAIVPEYAAENRPKLKVEFELLEIVEPVKPWDIDPSGRKETESGLHYILVEEGKGELPKTGQKVTVHYSGFLTDGTKFDSSVERGVPFEFELGLGRVIKGWDEGVSMFPIGSKVRLIVPHHLGYGEQGTGGIPPKSTLLFDVEIISAN